MDNRRNKSRTRSNNLYIIEDIPIAEPVKDNAVIKNEEQDPKNKVIPTYTIKMILVGDTHTGKTTTLNYLQNIIQCCENQTSTIGVEFASITRIIENTRFKYNIWDTAGQEKFRSITHSFYKNSGVAVLFFDLSNYRTFASITYWIKDIKMYCDPSIIILLVGNKCDKYNCRMVDQEDIDRFVEYYNTEYIEISAKTGKSIEYVLARPSEIILDKIKRRTPVVDIPGVRIKEYIEVKTKKSEHLCGKCIIS